MGNLTRCGPAVRERLIIAPLSKTGIQIIVGGIGICTREPGVVAFRDMKRIQADMDRVLELDGDWRNCLMGMCEKQPETLPTNIRLIREHLS